jgi:hypothetical protein
MSRITLGLAGLPVLSLMCAVAWAQPPSMAVAPLPLGRGDLRQAVTSETLAPGVDHYRIRRGAADKSGTWMLMSGVVTTPAGMDQVLKCFDTLGLKPAGASFQLDGSARQRYDILSGGRYATRAAAQAVEARARGLSCPLYARHSSEDHANASGPWMIDVVAVKPGSSFGLAAAVGQQGPGLRTLASKLAKTSGALAAVNGGFFVERDEDGFPGQPSGISVVDGRLNSGPVTARPAVLLRQGAAPAATIVRGVGVTSYLQWQDGSRTAIDGVNRRPGLVRDCGRDPLDPPVHDHTCAYDDDVVYFPAGGGFAPATARFAPPLVRYALGTDGVPRRLDAGVRPAAGDAVLALTGASKRLPEMERMAAANQPAVFKAESSVGGALAVGTHVVNGGPTLLMAGREVRDEVAEGWGIQVNDDARHDLLMHEWVNRRNPRTAFGIQDDGTVLLVTVDGHLHGASVGLTIDELRAVLKSLGARDAINLDGGGSTALVLGGRLVNHPSDPTGERAVGDAVVVLPGKGGGK